MNTGNKSQTNIRKRTRQEVNLNTTSEIPLKQTRYRSSRSGNMANNSREFIDLSGTINTRSGNVVSEKLGVSGEEVANSAENASGDQEIRGLVAEESLAIQKALEERMQNMVRDELNEIKKSMAELSKTVKELSVTRTQCQESMDSRQNNRNELLTNNVPVNNIRDFHLLVTGAAKDWYWLLVRTHGALRWPTLKNELRNQYSINTSNFEIMRDLVERKQHPHESLDTFFFEMSKLRARLMQPIPEFDMIKILKRNVRESVARIVYPIAVTSVEQLRTECQEAERNFPRKEIYTNLHQKRMNRNISELNYENLEEEENDLEEVAAANIIKSQPNLICWNCRLPGHGFRDCNSSERTLFCYRCGKPNVIAPRCPDCQQGNRLRDVGVTGDSRPGKNTN